MAEFGKRGRVVAAPVRAPAKASTAFSATPGIALYGVGAGAVMLLALGGVYWKMQRGGPAIGATSDPAACAAEFNAVNAAGKSAGPMHMDVRIDNDGHATAVIGDVIMPGSMHVKTQAAGQEVELVAIGDEAWVNLGGRWLATPGAADTIRKSMEQSQAMQAGFADKIRCTGSETLDGQSYLAYRFTGAVGGMEIDAVTYVDPVRRLPMIAQVSGKGGGGHSMKTSARFSYDASIRITKPQI